MIVTRASLSQGLLKQMPVLIPPCSEQIEISNYLQKREDIFLDITTKIELSITKLKEYKSTLINSAVTGEINF